MPSSKPILFFCGGRQGRPSARGLGALRHRAPRLEASFLAVNKIDSPEQQGRLVDFYALGVQDIYPVSSAHGFGVGDLFSEIVELIPEPVRGSR